MDWLIWEWDLSDLRIRVALESYSGTCIMRPEKWSLYTRFTVIFIERVMDLRDPSVSHIDNNSNKYCKTNVPWDPWEFKKEGILWKKRTTAMGENHKAGKLNFLPHDFTMQRCLSLAEPISRMIPLKLTLMLDLERTTNPNYEMVIEIPGAYYSYYYLKAWSWSTDILEVFCGDWSC